MPRNGREGNHLPFAHLFLDFPLRSISLLIGQKMNLKLPMMKCTYSENKMMKAGTSDMSKKHQFGEKLEIPNTKKDLHKVNQTPYTILSRTKIETTARILIETIQTKKPIRMKFKETNIPLKPKRRN